MHLPVSLLIYVYILIVSRILVCLLIVSRIYVCLLIVSRICVCLLIVSRIYVCLLIVSRILVCLLIVSRILVCLLIVSRIYVCLLIVSRIYVCLLIVSRIYVCLLIVSRIYVCLLIVSRIYVCLLIVSPIYVCLLIVSRIYVCLLIMSPIYVCLLIVSRIYVCLLIVSRIYVCLLIVSPIYVCLLIVPRVYVCLLIVPRVYVCLLIVSPVYVCLLIVSPVYIESSITPPTSDILVKGPLPSLNHHFSLIEAAFHNYNVVLVDDDATEGDSGRVKSENWSILMCTNTTHNTDGCVVSTLKPFQKVNVMVEMLQVLAHPEQLCINGEKESTQGQWLSGELQCSSSQHPNLSACNNLTGWLAESGKNFTGKFISCPEVGQSANLVSCLRCFQVFNVIVMFNSSFHPFILQVTPYSYSHELLALSDYLLEQNILEDLPVMLLSREQTSLQVATILSTLNIIYLTRLYPTSFFGRRTFVLNAALEHLVLVMERYFLGNLDTFEKISVKDGKEEFLELSNFTLGIGHNTAHLLVMEISRGGMYVLNTYKIIISRPSRNKLMGSFHIDQTHQHCSLPVIPTESCGLRASHYDSWSQFVQHGDSLNQCRSENKSSGQWMVPCLNCNDTTTCHWENATWNQPDCKESYLSQHELKKCLNQKKVLFIGDSTNRGIMHYIIYRLNGSLVEWDKTHNIRIYNLNQGNTTLGFAYYPQFWLAPRQRPLLDKALSQLFRSMGLKNSKVVVKGLGSGFHQPVSGIHQLSQEAHQKLQAHNQAVLSYARNKGSMPVYGLPSALESSLNSLAGVRPPTSWKVSGHGNDITVVLRWTECSSPSSDKTIHYNIDHNPKDRLPDSDWQQFQRNNLGGPQSAFSRSGSAHSGSSAKMETDALRARYSKTLPRRQHRTSPVPMILSSSTSMIQKPVPQTNKPCPVATYDDVVDRSSVVSAGSTSASVSSCNLGGSRCSSECMSAESRSSSSMDGSPEGSSHEQQIRSGIRAYLNQDIETGAAGGKEGAASPGLVDDYRIELTNGDPAEGDSLNLLRELTPENSQRCSRSCSPLNSPGQLEVPIHDSDHEFDRVGSPSYLSCEPSVPSARTKSPSEAESARDFEIGTPVQDEQLDEAPPADELVSGAADEELPSFDLDMACSNEGGFLGQDDPKYPEQFWDRYDPLNDTDLVSVEIEAESPLGSISDEM
ncbi:hypothetical protein Btru_017221 [Bulinus truncatus]|nr:hypothetical protein Btru_017221 [Bulinus truncatus]